MSVAVARRVWLVAILSLAPAPLLLFGGELAPPARYALLLAATLAIAVREGAAGPVPMLAALFAAHLLVYLALAWLASRAVGRLLTPLAPSARGWITLGMCGLALAAALTLPLYRTPLGPRPTATLLGALS